MGGGGSRLALHLTDGQLRKIRELQELLATPLRFPDATSWTAACHEAVTDLFGVERSLLVLPNGAGEVQHDSPNLSREALRAYREALTGTRAGANRYGDPVLDRGMRRLAAAGVEIWTREIAERVSRVDLEAMPRFFPEVIRPHRLAGLLVMAHSLPEGRAMLHVFSDEGRRGDFGEEDVGVFRLLLPAFKAGSRAYALDSRRRSRLRTTLDLLQEGAAVFRGGTEVYRNRALRRLLSAEEREEELVQAIADCAGTLQRALEKRDAPGGDFDSSTELATPTNRYRLAASLMEGGYAQTPLTVLVVVRPAAPPLPDASELRERYGLTPRQAEVATLLIRGCSNREIADRLTISPHTARHHAQRVLEKTRLHSRKALALHLLGDGRS